MYATNTLSGPQAGDIVTAWPAPRSEEQDGVSANSTGGTVGTDAEAETGPYRTITETSGTGARRVLAEQLFAAHYPKLAGWVRRLVDDDETAHEIASEAFVRLLSKWTSPDKLDSPQSYLYMIATNLVRDHWRKLERERRAMSKAAAGAETDPSTDPSVDVDIRELIAALPARLREPFLLHYYAGFGVKEIALQLKRPEGTIKADLYHARARLKEAIKSRTGPMPVQRKDSAAERSATPGTEDSGLGRANAG
jgi:RNA polymerase sigma-70 factor, ECF subfamily